MSTNYSRYRTIKLDVSEHIKVSLTYPENSKVVLAMNGDGGSMATGEDAIVLELEPVNKDRAAALVSSPHASANLETEPISPGAALWWRSGRPPYWRTPGLYQRKRCNDINDEDVPEVINFPTLTSPTRSTSRT